MKRTKSSYSHTDTADDDDDVDGDRMIDSMLERGDSAPNVLPCLSFSRSYFLLSIISSPYFFQFSSGFLLLFTTVILHLYYDNVDLFIYGLI